MSPSPDHWPRLTIITGKGGVGKTVHAIALTRALNSQGIKTQYCLLADSEIQKEASFDVQDINQEILEIPHLILKLKECSLEYLSRKLHSKILAKAILKAPFFPILINMIPGLHFVITLGKLLHELQENPELHVVLDAPSTGHATALLRAPFQFQEIFSKGLLHRDTQEMTALLKDSSFTKIFCLCYPRALDVQEAKEFHELTHALLPAPAEIILNSCLSEVAGHQAFIVKTTNDTSLYLAAKIREEVAILQSHGKDLLTRAPYVASSPQSEEFYRGLEQFWTKMLIERAR